MPTDHQQQHSTDGAQFTVPSTARQERHASTSKKIHKFKSYLVTTLNKTLRKHYHTVPTTLNIAHIKSLLKEINSVLKAEYRLAYTKYWDTLIKHIDHTKPDKFFPKINRFFRPKNQLQIEGLTVKADRLPLLNRS